MKKLISSIVILFAVTMMVFSIYGLAQSNSKTNTIIKTDPNGIVILELFTSQGCSSCPPADVILSKYALDNRPNIIPLAFHVDYWNHIGWKDPFSKAQYSDRQREYAEVFNSSGVYTPQLVINGKYELVGSNEKKIAEIVSEEITIHSNASIKIISNTLQGDQLLVKFNAFDEIKTSKINLALVKKKEFTKIKRGENNGLEQTSYNIVYDFKSIALNNAKENEMTFKFLSNWKTEDFIVVAYIQNKSNGIISTAIKSEINF